MSVLRMLPWYYAATVVFLLLDYIAGVNVRVAFLESQDGVRAAYYAFCFACLGLMIWRPSWITLVTTVESLVTLVALIVGMAVRVMLPNDAIFAENASFVTYQEVVNFLISGSIAYFAWSSGLKALSGR